ncbi:MAG: L-seryl-tRNA(Sec) selenium transferase [Betaproteobacteria bacterium RIFCSPLOWO2_02_FULL_62_17]|nr:MAG: L-seryl-tRNA(Sec) selenium transferase [Betaproteobacteria bacterium RIFCSPLOWO2_02_FULL_62_17]
MSQRPPSVDAVLRHEAVALLVAQHGRPRVVAAIREELEGMRSAGPRSAAVSAADEVLARIAAGAGMRLQVSSAPSLRPVFNLTGVVLHTNLGRALLPDVAVQAMQEAARQAVNIEFELDTGKRGDRDRHLESLLQRLTGAEQATVVNNNAAAVLLALNTLGLRREVILSRGELIEIGGEFRMPEIMKRAGCKLVEVGTTNRTHLKDYEQAIGPKTGLIMKVHPSNYEIRGFTKTVDEASLAELARRHALPFISDLGAGTLLDLRLWNLPHETTPAELIKAGVDLVTFSGDKLLGGPQAGLLVGRRELIERIRRNPLKRALRVDKLRIAALEAVLRLYQDPERLAQRLPILRHMTRKPGEIEAQAQRLLPAFADAFAGAATVSVAPCESEAGSGSLPSDRLQSFGLAITAEGDKRKATAQVEALARACRALPVPVIGRVRDGSLYLDLRCLDDEAGLLGQLSQLALVS